MSMSMEILGSQLFRRVAAALFLASFAAVFALVFLAAPGGRAALSLAAVAWAVLAAAVVAGSGLAVIGALVIAPVLKTRYRLREVLKRPREADAPAEAGQPRDEIGDIAVAVERLRDHLAAAEAERRALRRPFA